MGNLKKTYVTAKCKGIQGQVRVEVVDLDAFVHVGPEAMMAVYVVLEPEDGEQPSGDEVVVNVRKGDLSEFEVA